MKSWNDIIIDIMVINTRCYRDALRKKLYKRRIFEKSMYSILI